MKQVDYHKIINKYIKPGTPLHNIYVPHATLVTAKAVAIGQRLKIPAAKIRFIESAGMLHDIGIIKVNVIDFQTTGRPYIQHLTEGAEILRREKLPKHARVAETHSGVGIYKEDIKKYNIPLPLKDYITKTIEEKIISFADLFYSKIPERLFMQNPLEKIKKEISGYGKKYEKILNEWIKTFL